MMLLFPVLCVFATTIGTVLGTVSNVAAGKPADQTHVLFWNFDWAPDKAVDGCLLRDDPNTQGCCSASMTEGENAWWVDLEDIYSISSIVVYGRQDDDGGQLLGFQVFVQDAINGGAETLVYTDSGGEYGDAMFTVTLPEPLTASRVIIKRMEELTICEAEVYGVLAGVTTTTAGTTKTTETTSITPESTTTASTSASTTSQEDITSAKSTAGTNIALNKPATQTQDSVWPDYPWIADYAVNGCKDRHDPNTYARCCSTSDAAGENVWSVDLQQTYPIGRIVVYGRTDSTVTQLSGFQMYVQDGSGPEFLVHDNTDMDYGDGLFTERFAVPRMASKVILKRTGILTICEVEVFQACDDGVYGDQCNQPCGQCAGDDPCDKVTGHCPAGCMIGWQELMCNVETQDKTSTTVGTESTTTDMQVSSSTTDATTSNGILTPTLILVV